MNHINDLIDGLKKDFTRCEKEPKYLSAAHERAVIAGKIIKAYALQIAHSVQKHECADIPFLQAKTVPMLPANGVPLGKRKAIAENRA